MTWNLIIFNTTYLSNNASSTMIQINKNNKNWYLTLLLKILLQMAEYIVWVMLGAPLVNKFSANILI